MGRTRYDGLNILVKWIHITAVLSTDLRRGASRGALLVPSCVHHRQLRRPQCCHPFSWSPQQNPLAQRKWSVKRMTIP
uniref:Uncharacterized protein n=1 Tax=Triticum urartu TaxID=4572 RepID=A0A8R7QX62_TRIUA